MTYETFDVPVDGGTLHCGQWGSGDVVVLAAHGITANHIMWAPIAEQLGDGIRLIAPDLRGRGRSSAIEGPWGMAAHADDLAAVLDHAAVNRALLLGSSMGGFVAVVAASRHPERFSRVVLLDGGLPLDLGPLLELPIEQLTAAVIGPALERLRMTFPSRQAYRDYWKQHPALADDWNAAIEAYIDYDLVGAEPELRSSVREDAVLGDSESQLVADDIPRAVDPLARPTLLLRAPRGLFNQVPPLYPDEAAAAWEAQLENLRVELVPDVNHYTLLVSERGAKAVAAYVADELAQVEGR
jgi:pimeloyl-ACP methyl ester carboxylesterase